MHTDLGDVQRRHHGQHTDPHTADQPSHCKHGIVDGSGLQDGANGEDHDRDNDGVATRDAVCNPTLVQCTEQGSQFDHCGQQALPETGTSASDTRELLEELVHDQDHGHDTLIITKDQATQGRAGGAHEYKRVGHQSAQAGWAIGLPVSGDIFGMVGEAIHGGTFGELLRQIWLVCHGDTRKRA